MFSKQNKVLKKGEETGIKEHKSRSKGDEDEKKKLKIKN